MILGRTLFVCATAALFLLLLILKKESYRLLCGCYIVLIALIALFVEPQYDLYSYIFGRMRQMADMSLSQFLTSSYMESSEPVAMLYFYVLSKSPYKAVLMSCTTLLVYGLMFALVFRVEKWWELSKSVFSILIIWIVATTPYYTVLAGIRYQLAFAIFEYALYFELVEKQHKKLCWVGFAAAILIHNSTVVLLLIRLALIFYKKLSGWATTAVVFISVAAIMPIINLLSGAVDSQFLLSILDKAEGYYGEGGSALSTGNWIIAIMMVLCGVIAYVARKKYCGEGDELSDVANYMLLLLAFCLGSITSSDVFSRFGTAVKLVAFPLFAASFHAMQGQIEQAPQSKYIRNQRTPAGAERIMLEFTLLISAAMYLGYQYLGKLTLMTLRWPPV